MAYGIIRVEKVKRAAVGSMQYHNDRVPGEHSNEDIDPDKTKDNKEYVRHGSYRAEVAERIERNRTSGRKVRKDAVVLCEGIATASPEFFEGKTYEETMAYFDDVFEFVKAEAGADNLIHFTVHMDETTPHAHFGFTPIKDGSLSWKKFFDGKYALRAFQDRHWEQVGRKWGLERGEKSEDTGRTHKDTAQMKRDAARELHQVEQRVEQGRETLGEVEQQVAQTSERLEGLQQREVQLGEEIEELQPAAVTFPESVRQLVSSCGNGSRLQSAEAEKAELEPPTETIAESARSLWEARGSGKREEVLRSEIEGLRSRLSASEGESRELAGEIRELERGISRLERGIIGARERVQELAAQVRGCVEHVGERVAAVLTGFGVRAYAGAAPLSEHVRDVRDASRELGRAGSDQERGRGWDMSR